MNTLPFLSLDTGMLAGRISKHTPEKKEKTLMQIAREAASKRASFDPDLYGLDSCDSGVSVIPFADATTRAQLRVELAAYVDSMPEYAPLGLLPIPYDKNEQIVEPNPNVFGNGALTNPSTFDNDDFFPVEGGFAAMGNPSSFHNLFVRKLRMAAHVAVLESDAIPIAPDENFEQVADRLMVRRSSKNPTAEAWHRDEAKFAVPGDTVYGGWLNLDTERAQVFSMVPSSANEVTGQNHGFARIDESEHVEMVNRSFRVDVPPGHILIFNERTIHEVVARPFKGSEIRGKTGSQLARCRLFFGWRTTKATTPITPNLDARLEAQEALPIKSGQHVHPNPPPGALEYYPGPPAMYSKLHATNSPLLLKRLASHLKPAATELYKYKPGGKQAERFPNGLAVPKLFMPSLKDLNAADSSISMYVPYTDAERSILVPSRSWRNLTRLDGSTVPELSV